MRALAVAVLLVACDAPPRSSDASWNDRRPPHGVPRGALALVVNSGSDSVTVVDLARNRAAATVPLDLDPLANDAPIDVLFDGDDLFAVFAYPSAHGAGPHAGAHQKAHPGLVARVRVDDLQIVAASTLEENPADVVRLPDGRLAVSHFNLAAAFAASQKGRPVAEQRGRVAFVDPQTLERRGGATVCVAPDGLAVTSDALFVACHGEDAVAEVSFDGRSVQRHALGSAPVDAKTFSLGPRRLVLAGSTLLVTETRGRALAIFDLPTRSIAARVRFVGEPGTPATSADLSRVVVPIRTHDLLIAIDARTWTVEATRSLPFSECTRPRAVVRREQRWFVLCEGIESSRVLEIDGSTLATIRSFEAGARASVLAFAEAR